MFGTKHWDGDSQKWLKSSLITECVHSDHLSLLLYKRTDSFRKQWSSVCRLMVCSHMPFLVFEGNGCWMCYYHRYGETTGLLFGDEVKFFLALGLQVAAKEHEKWKLIQTMSSKTLVAYLWVYSLYIKNLAIMTSPVSKWSWILKSRFLHYGHNPVFEARRMMNDHWAAALQSLEAEAEYGADQLFLIDLLSIVYWALWPPLAAITN